MRTYNLLLRN